MLIGTWKSHLCARSAPLKAFSPASSCEEAAAAQAQVLKLYEESTATKERTVVKEAISAVFARCAPFPIDAAAITALLQNLAQGAESEWADVAELELPGIEFVVMYAPVCPERFVNTDLMEHLTDCIKSNQHVDSVMAIFLAIAKAELDASCDLTHLKKPLTKLATQGTATSTCFRPFLAHVFAPHRPKCRVRCPF